MINKNIPYEIHAEIESRCALDCIHCSSYKLKESSKINFNFADLSNFLNRLNSKAHLYLTGGEPLLNNNISQNIKYLKDNVPCLSVGMFTSGVVENKKPISQDFAHDLKASGLEDCYVSLYHSTSDKHDIMTGSSGSYDTTCTSISHLIAANIDVKAHLVINKLNFFDFEYILSELLDRGISQLRILRIVKTGNADVNWDKIGISVTHQNQIIQKIITNISEYDSRITISGFPSQIACRPFPFAQKCQAGISLFYISGNGEIYPCACTKNEKKYMIGDIKDDQEKILKFIAAHRQTLFNNSCLNTMSAWAPLPQIDQSI